MECEGKIGIVQTKVKKTVKSRDLRIRFVLNQVFGFKGN